MQLNAVMLGVWLIFWGVEARTISNQAKSIYNFKASHEPPNKLHYQTWCGKSCGFPAHVDRKTEFCEGGQVA